MKSAWLGDASRRWRRYAGWSALLIAVGLAADASAAPRESRSRAAKAAEASLPNVTYIGFRLLGDGRALVSVELSGAVPVNVENRGRVVTYVLAGARVAFKNNTNPLLTGGFPTILESARVTRPDPPARHGGRAKPAAAPRVEVVLQLREQATTSHVLRETSSGAVLEITLPPPKQ